MSVRLAAQHDVRPNGILISATHCILPSPAAKSPLICPVLFLPQLNPLLWNIVLSGHAPW